MNKPFTTIKTNVANDIQDTSTAMLTLIGVWSNNRYFQILRAINWENIRTDYTISVTSGTQDYALPEDFGKEVYILDTTNGNEIGIVTLGDLVRDYPSSITTAGTVQRAVITDDTVLAQPTSSSVIAISTTSASDTTQTVLVRGISSGIETSESVTLNGSSVNTTNSYTRIKAISKSANTVGKISGTSNSAAVTIFTMSPKVNESRVKKIKFHYSPASSLTVSLPYIVKPLPMTESYDYPVIDIADIIELGTKADAYRYKKQFAKASVLESLFMNGLADIIWEKENQPNKVTQYNPTTYNVDNLY